MGTYCVLGLMQYNFHNSKGIKFISEKQTQGVLEIYPGTSLAVQWLEVHASTAGGTGLIPGWENWDPACCMVQQKKRGREKRKQEIYPKSNK